MEMINVKKDGLIFELDNTNFTATVIYSPDACDDIFLERSINYKSRSYTITKIAQKAFRNNLRIKSISFSKDSELLSIGKKAFAQSSLRSLTIPSKFESFGKDWCLNAQSLRTICISEENKNFQFLDDEKQIVVGKSDPNSKIFDVIVFASCNIYEVTIPSTIKQIGNCSFYNCNLKIVNFEKKSKLEIIHKNAFKTVSIGIEIPPSVKELKDCWMCKSLYSKSSIIISPENPNFKVLDNKMIVGKSDRNSDEFDSIIMGFKDIKEIVIPSTIKYINAFAFSNYSLHKVEFQDHSKLISIGKCAFFCTYIQQIKIPASCKKIGKMAFYDCNNLSSVDVPLDSQLVSISSFVFYNSKIKNIVITSYIENLKQGWCDKTDLLANILIHNNPNFSFLDDESKVVVSKSDLNSDVFDTIVLACHDITHVFIPSTITRIGSYAFSGCSQLQTVEFSKDSKLKSIGYRAFKETSFANIDIPSSVTEILSDCFVSCPQLQSINIPNDSQLKVIGVNAFDSNQLQKIFIPSNVAKFPFGLKPFNEISISSENKYFRFLDEEKLIIVGKKDKSADGNFDIILRASVNIQRAFIPSKIKYIDNCAFRYCSNLQEVNFDENSQLISIGTCAFNGSSITKMTIPSSVESIGHMSFGSCNQLQEVDFEPNSKLKVLSAHLFEYSSIESLSFPSNIEELNSSWCSRTPRLKNIFLPPENTNFAYSDESHNLIIGKSNSNQNVFDTVVFACRNCKEVAIPSTIKIIKCYAFSFTNIRKVFIPKSVTHIEKYAFANCSNISSIEFENESKLGSIGEMAFTSPLIENILIPSKVKSFDMMSFDGCRNLTSVEFLSEEMILSMSFQQSKNKVISFPNACNIKIKKQNKFDESLILFICPNTRLEYYS